MVPRVPQHVELDQHGALRGRHVCLFSLQCHVFVSFYVSCFYSTVQKCYALITYDKQTLLGIAQLTLHIPFLNPRTCTALFTPKAITAIHKKASPHCAQVKKLI